MSEASVDPEQLVHPGLVTTPEDSDSSAPHEGCTPSEREDEESTEPVMSKNWLQDYQACPKWGDVLEAVTSPGVEWPKGVQILDDRLYLDARLCVPTPLVGRVIREHHSVAGHPGGDRLWAVMGRFYVFPDPTAAKKLAGRVKAQCEVCQSSDPSRQPFKVPIEPFPVPPYLMDSVSVDLFSMPEVSVAGKVYDTLVLCVDRESGWMVGTAHRGKGLLASDVAKAMWQHWSLFGVPSRVSSDQGPHFASAWWQTLCAVLGVRVAYGQAYHHQAQGRVENAGQQVKRQLTRVDAEGGAPWVELLPRVLNQLHDLPGPSGLSPYEIVFGRHRPMGGLPYRPRWEAEDANRFLAKMRDQDAHVARVMNALHEKRAAYVNAKRRHPVPLLPGSKVWYRPEPQPGTDPLDVRWKGPG
jgi:hypothetical protein